MNLILHGAWILFSFFKFGINIDCYAMLRDAKLLYLQTSTQELNIVYHTIMTLS